MEKDRERCSDLEDLKSEFLERSITIQNSDANEFLASFSRDWDRCRGVLFLDPFGAELEWRTLERIAGFNALDAWILVPVATIARMLPTRREPDEISDQWSQRLTKIYGGESWRGLYRNDPQQVLFGEASRIRTPGIDDLVRIYKKQLRTLFGIRLLERSCQLKNSKNVVLYEFMFCVGSPDC